MTALVERLLRPLKRRIQFLVRRGLLALIDDGQGLQHLQMSLLAGELRDGVERFQEYGFSSVPDVGAEAILVAVGAQPGYLVAIAVDDKRYRPVGGLPGEVTLYSKFGQCLRLKADGTVELTGASLFKVNGNLQVTGNIVGGGAISDVTGSMATMRADYNLHTHIENGVPATPPTNPPLPQMV